MCLIISMCLTTTLIQRQLYTPGEGEGYYGITDMISATIIAMIVNCAACGHLGGGRSMQPSIHVGGGPGPHTCSACSSQAKDGMQRLAAAYTKVPTCTYKQSCLSTETEQLLIVGTRGGHSTQ